MRRIKPRVKYQGISFAVPFLDEIKKHIMYNPKYRSIADFAREALREKMQRDQSNSIEYFNEVYKKMSDEEIVKEMMAPEQKILKIDSIAKKSIDASSLEGLKETIVSHRKLKEKEMEELQRKKGETIIQMSKSDLSKLIQDTVEKVVTEKIKPLSDQKEK